MEYLIALIPALGWGLMPLITGKMGGSEANQIFGIGAGASIVGIIAFLITQPTVSAGAFIFSMVCGALWSTAQIGQFVSFKRMGGFLYDSAVNRVPTGRELPDRGDDLW